MSVWGLKAMKPIQVTVNLSESEINSIITALETYYRDLPEEFWQKEYLPLKRRLHTALTLEKLKRIDEGI
jgi:hypothetical protein